METNVFCSLFSQIKWGWYLIAVVVAFLMGAWWYWGLFTKAWERVFKVTIPKKGRIPEGVLFAISMQFLVTALMGIVFFMLVKVSLWLAILALVAFCGWQKAGLKFRYIKWKDYFTAAMIEAGYTFVAGIILIIFACV